MRARTLLQEPALGTLRFLTPSHNMPFFNAWVFKNIQIKI